MTRHSVGGGHGDIVMGAVEEAAGLLPRRSERVLVVHSVSVEQAANRVATAVRETGRTTALAAVPDGEAAKDIGTAVELWTALAAHGVGRGDAVVAVGGGAVTDVAGFAAATWLRGVAVVHVPTTLLGMVDAAIGGKTAIDVPAGKNLVGAFHLPAGVVVDVRQLASLPDADYVAGLAEVAKAGFVGDPAILDLLEQWTPDVLARAPDVLNQLVELAVLVKADVVAADPREAGQREILNYGHTLAHAIEKVAGFGVWRHGDAVAVGLCFAAALGRVSGRLDGATADRHRTLLLRLGLPTTYDGAAWSWLHEAMSMDKKARGSRLRFVVLEGVGRPVILEDPAPDLLEAAYREVSA